MMTQLRDRIKEFARIPVAKLRANPRNWRTHPEAQRKALRGMLDEIGFSSAVIARELPDGTYELIDGHLRLETLAATDRIPTLILDVDEGEADKLLLTLDPLASMAGTDKEMLAGLFESTSFEDDALASLIAETTGYEFDLEDDEGDGEDTEPQIDKAEELRAKWGVERGQLWRLGEHLLLCGDSTSADDVERLMNGEQAGICFTSPPYNLGSSVGLRNGSRSGAKSAYNDFDDSDKKQWASIMSQFMRHALKVCEYLIVNVQLLAGNKVDLLNLFGEFAINTADVGVWVKSNPPPAMAEKVMTSAFEFLWVLARDEMPSRAIKTSDFIRGSRLNVFFSSTAAGHDSAVHGAVFPLSLAVDVVSSFSRPSMIVYEPFSGSGTTLIACENLGRKCRAIEISPAYVAVAIQRWADHTGGTPERVK